MRCWLVTLGVQVDWEVCPPEAACCNEFGYCRTKVCVETRNKTFFSHVDLKGNFSTDNSSQ